jgi:hypothetical protein
MKHRNISAAEYRHGKYGLYGAMSIVSTLLVAGLLVALNMTAVVLAIISNRWQKSKSQLNFGK